MNINDISLEEVSRYIGTNIDEIDKRTLNDIHDAVDSLKLNLSFKSTYKMFDIIHEENKITLDGTSLIIESENVREMLKECDKCILLAVTLGENIDRLLRTMQVQNISKAVIFDACASSMIENLCNNYENELNKSLQNPHFTDRFSPGYGDFPLEISTSICRILSTDRTIGLSVTQTGIMLPRKSITAIIGISNKPQPKIIKGCNFCNLANDCPYKKKGINCV